MFIISSIFYNLPQDTSSFNSRGTLLFFAILINAFSSILEILTVYAQRPIVEKHKRYALYHPSAEALASMLTDMPYKVVNSILFNLVLYFMTNLKREPGEFFIFVLISFLLTLVMSSLSRTIASVSRTSSQALAPTAVLMIALVIYAGYGIPTPYMLGLSRWINYIDPITYGFEAMMINEFHGRNYTCSRFVPEGLGYTDENQVCSAVVAVTGQGWVNGDSYIESAFEYKSPHMWRNIGIVAGFFVLFTSTYLLATDLVSSKKSKGEVLVFPRGKSSKILSKSVTKDLEKADQDAVLVANGNTGQQSTPHGLVKQTSLFQWQDVSYDIKIKGEP